MWTDNDLKHTDPREPHQICFLFRVPYDVMAIQQNVDPFTRPLLMVASASPQDDPLDYKVKYVVHQAHLIM